MEKILKYVNLIGKFDGGVSFIGGCDRSDRTKPAASDWQT
jgi:hypothetical protein